MIRPLQFRVGALALLVVAAMVTALLLASCSEPEKTLDLACSPETVNQDGLVTCILTVQIGQENTVLAPWYGVIIENSGGATVIEVEFNEEGLLLQQSSSVAVNRSGGSSDDDGGRSAVYQIEIRTAGLTTGNYDVTLALNSGDQGPYPNGEETIESNSAPFTVTPPTT